MVASLSFRHRVGRQVACLSGAPSEEIMQTPAKHYSRVQTGRSGSISIHIHGPVIDSESEFSESLRVERTAIPPAVLQLFENAVNAPAPLPERFPRLTFLAISVALL